MGAAMTCDHCKLEVEPPAVTVRVSVRAKRLGNDRVELNVCSRCFRDEYLRPEKRP